MGPSQNFHGSSISSQNFSSRVEFRAKNFRAVFKPSLIRAANFSSELEQCSSQQDFLSTYSWSKGFYVSKNVFCSNIMKTLMKKSWEMYRTYDVLSFDFVNFKSSNFRAWFFRANFESSIFRARFFRAVFEPSHFRAANFSSELEQCSSLQWLVPITSICCRSIVSGQFCMNPIFTCLRKASTYYSKYTKSMTFKLRRKYSVFLIDTWTKDKYTAMDRSYLPSLNKYLLSKPVSQKIL